MKIVVTEQDGLTTLHFVPAEGRLEDATNVTATPGNLLAVIQAGIHEVYTGNSVQIDWKEAPSPTSHESADRR